MKAVFFDFDGLIVDTETCEYEAYKKIYASYGVSFDEKKWFETIGTISSFDPFEKLVRHVPMLEKDKILKIFHRYFEKNITMTGAREGVVDQMKWLQAQSIQIAIVSSSSKDWVLRHSEAVGILPYVDQIFTKEDVAAVKPDPALYEKALEAFRLRPEQALVFEDSKNGSLAAIRAGIPCIVITNFVTKRFTFPKEVIAIYESHKQVDFTQYVEEI